MELKLGLGMIFLNGQEVKQEAKGVEEKKEYDIPDEVEEVIEELADWLADEVVGSLLELFTLKMDTGWHGDCLALAELGRRDQQRLERVPSRLS